MALDGSKTFGADTAAPFDTTRRTSVGSARDDDRRKGDGTCTSSPTGEREGNGKKAVPTGGLEGSSSPASKQQQRSRATSVVERAALLAKLRATQHRQGPRRTISKVGVALKEDIDNFQEHLQFVENFCLQQAAWRGGPARPSLLPRGSLSSGGGQARGASTVASPLTMNGRDLEENAQEQDGEEGTGGGGEGQEHNAVAAAEEDFFSTLSREPCVFLSPRRRGYFFETAQGSVHVAPWRQLHDSVLSSSERLICEHYYDPFRRFADDGSKFRQLVDSLSPDLDDDEYASRLMRAGHQERSLYTLDLLMNIMAISKLEDGQQTQEEFETLAAFVQLGGHPDRGGFVDADVLRKVCKSFALTIDVEAMIEEVDEDGSGVIEFDEFEQFYHELRTAAALEQAEYAHVGAEEGEKGTPILASPSGPGGLGGAADRQTPYAGAGSPSYAHGHGTAAGGKRVDTTPSGGSSEALLFKLNETFHHHRNRERVLVNHLRNDKPETAQHVSNREMSTLAKQRLSQASTTSPSVIGGIPGANTSTTTDATTATSFSRSGKSVAASRRLSTGGGYQHSRAFSTETEDTILATTTGSGESSARADLGDTVSTVKSGTPQHPHTRRRASSSVVLAEDEMPKEKSHHRHHHHQHRGHRHDQAQDLSLSTKSATSASTIGATSQPTSPLSPSKHPHRSPRRRHTEEREEEEDEAYADDSFVDRDEEEGEDQQKIDLTPTERRVVPIDEDDDHVSVQSPPVHRTVSEPRIDQIYRSEDAILQELKSRQTKVQKRLRKLHSEAVELERLHELHLELQSQMAEERKVQEAEHRAHRRQSALELRERSQQRKGRRGSGDSTPTESQTPTTGVRSRHRQSPAVSASKASSSSTRKPRTDTTPTPRYQQPLHWQEKTSSSDEQNWKRAGSGKEATPRTELSAHEQPVGEKTPRSGRSTSTAIGYSPSPPVPVCGSDVHGQQHNHRTPPADLKRYKLSGEYMVGGGSTSQQQRRGTATPPASSAPYGQRPSHLYYPYHRRLTQPPPATKTHETIDETVSKHKREFFTNPQVLSAPFRRENRRQIFAPAEPRTPRAELSKVEYMLSQAASPPHRKKGFDNKEGSGEGAAAAEASTTSDTNNDDEDMSSMMESWLKP